MSCACGCGLLPRANRRFVHGHNTPRAQASPHWKGGRRIDRQGYVRLYRPDHPRAATNGYAPEHVVVVEEALGHPLPEGAQVHHVNEDRADNRPVNLVACQDNSYHKLLHQRQRALEACGYAGWLKCVQCKIYDDPANMYVLPAKLGGHQRRAFHRECDRKAQRERRQRRSA